MMKNILNNQLIKSLPWPLLLIVVTSLAFKMYYLLELSYLEGHIFSDMAGYWNRAHSFMQGEYSVITQWAVWPMGFHVFLGVCLKAFSVVGIESHGHVLFLSFFVILSTLSVIGVYAITKNITGHEVLSTIAAFLYAFCFPLIYINTFLLPQNISEPLIILSLVLVLRKKECCWNIALSGTCLAAAVYFRPNIGFLGLPFFLYLLFKNGFSKNSFFRAMVFSVSFFAVVLLAVFQAWTVSDGQLKGLSSNGGGSFFIQHCKPHQFGTVYEGYATGGHFITHPSVSHKKENGLFMTHEPWHNQKYFYELAMNCIERSPEVLLHNILNMKDLFWGPFFPGYGRAWGFPKFMSPSKMAVIFFMVLMFVGYFLKSESAEQRKKEWFLLGVWACYTLPFYFFGVEPRYYFSMYFLFFIGSMCCLSHVRLQWKRFAMVLFMWFVALALSWIAVLYSEKQKEIANTRVFDLEDYEEKKPSGYPANAWGNIIFRNKNEKIVLKTEKDIVATQVELSRGFDDVYKLYFYQDKKFLGLMTVHPKFPQRRGLHTQVFDLPKPIQGAPFNRIIIYGREGNKKYSIGHLRFID